MSGTNDTPRATIEVEVLCDGPTDADPRHLATVRTANGECFSVNQKSLTNLNDAARRLLEPERYELAFIDEWLKSERWDVVCNAYEATFGDGDINYKQLLLTVGAIASEVANRFAAAELRKVACNCADAVGNCARCQSIERLEGRDDG